MTRKLHSTETWQEFWTQMQKHPIPGTGYAQTSCVVRSRASASASLITGTKEGIGTAENCFSLCQESPGGPCNMKRWWSLPVTKIKSTSFYPHLEIPGNRYWRKTLKSPILSWRDGPVIKNISSSVPSTTWNSSIMRFQCLCPVWT